MTWLDRQEPLTLDVLRNIVTCAVTVIGEGADADEHAELLEELRGVVTLCEDAAMTSGELLLPARRRR